jgi:hypothetical protein
MTTPSLNPPTPTGKSLFSRHYLDVHLPTPRAIALARPVIQAKHMVCYVRSRML